jgi:hypothetical protein
MKGSIARDGKTGPHVRVVQVAIATEKETEWNRWYDTIHVPAIAACPGYISVRRFRSLNGEAKYMTIYEIESPAATETKEFQQARGWGPFETSVSDFVATTYEEISRYPVSDGEA